MTLDELIAKIKSDDPDTRTEGWLKAGEVGAPAIKPLAKVLAQTGGQVEKLKTDASKKKEMGNALESGRAAKRGMFKIVRTVGAPGAKKEDQDAVVNALVGLLGDDQPAAVRREVLWMLSEIGCCVAAVGAVAGLLSNAELREDARCCLERIPGDISLGALKAGLDLKSVADDFKINIAQSLRARGVDVSQEKYPCQKLVPTKKTSVKPVG